MDRQFKPRAFAVIARLETMVSLHDVPSVIPTSFNNVNLFESVLAYITCPQGSVSGIETKAPRIAKAICVDLLTVSIGILCERIVRWNTILFVAFLLVNVNPEYATEQCRSVLSMIMGVVARAPVSD